jgi:hypothetical protein
LWHLYRGSTVFPEQVCGGRLSEGKTNFQIVAAISMATLFLVYAFVARAGGTQLPALGREREEPKLASLFDERGRHVGDTLVVRASLFDGTRPVEDAEVSAEIGLPNDARIPIALADDGRVPDSVRGDGIFSGTGLVLSTPGRHSLYIIAKRPEPRYLHAVRANHFTVARSRSHFDGRIQDRLVDGNGDGLVDHLRLGVGVTVTDSVRLSVTAFLSAGGKALQGTANQRVGVGDHVLDVDAFLGRLVTTGYQGVFVVDSLTLDEDGGSHGIYPLNSRSRPYTTGPYTIVADTLRSPYWNGRVTAHGVDRDKDGRFESLVVDLGVAGLGHAGQYYCHAELARGPWSLTLGGEYLMLPRDSATVRFEFPGSCIAKTPSPDKLLVRRFALFYLESGRVSKLPHTNFNAGNIPIELEFAAEAFEPKGPAKFRSKTGGTYECW